MDLKRRVNNLLKSVDPDTGDCKCPHPIKVHVVEDGTPAPEAEKCGTCERLIQPIVVEIIEGL